MSGPPSRRGRGRGGGGGAPLLSVVPGPAASASRGGPVRRAHSGPPPRPPGDCDARCGWGTSFSVSWLLEDSDGREPETSRIFAGEGRPDRRLVDLSSEGELAAGPLGKEDRWFQCCQHSFQERNIVLCIIYVYTYVYIFRINIYSIKVTAKILGLKFLIQFRNPVYYLARFCNPS